MKSVLISIQPKWCELIANGNKTIEVRKTRPKLETPFKVYIYCTKGKFALLRDDGDTEKYKYDVWDYAEFHQSCGKTILGSKVIGEFVCNHITNIEVLKSGLFTGGNPNGHCVSVIEKSMLSPIEIKDYAKNKTNVYAWHISNLVIYDKPRELSEFRKECKLECDMRSLKEPPCEKCEHLVASFGCGRTITRPPQSWCYVESEVQGE